MQSKIEPHDLPIAKPNATILNAIAIAMPRSTLCNGGTPNKGIMNITKQDSGVR